MMRAERRFGSGSARAAPAFLAVGFRLPGRGCSKACAATSSSAAASALGSRMAHG